MRSLVDKAIASNSGDPLLFFATLNILASCPVEAEADCV